MFFLPETGQGLVIASTNRVRQNTPALETGPWVRLELHTGTASCIVIVLYVG